MKNRTAWLASALAAALLLAGAASAQPPDDRPRGPRGPGGPPPGPPGGPGGLERVVRGLDLTPKQQEELRKALREHHEQMQKDLLARMKKVLSEKQYEAFTKSLERSGPGARGPGRRGGPPDDRRGPGRRGEPRGPGGPPGGPGGPGGPGFGPPGALDRVIEDLRLSEKQEEQVRKVLRAHHDKVRKQMEEARTGLFKDLEKVLNKRQLEQLKTALERRPPGPPGRRPGRPGRPGEDDDRRPPPRPRD